MGFSEDGDASAASPLAAGESPSASVLAVVSSSSAPGAASSAGATGSFSGSTGWAGSGSGSDADICWLWLPWLSAAPSLFDAACCVASSWASADGAPAAVSEAANSVQIATRAIFGNGVLCWRGSASS